MRRIRRAREIKEEILSKAGRGSHDRLAFVLAAWVAELTAEIEVLRARLDAAERSYDCAALSHGLPRRITVESSNASS